MGDLNAFTTPAGSTRLCHDHWALRASTLCLLMSFISFCHCSDRANRSCRFQNVRWIRGENRIGQEKCRTGRCFASSINGNEKSTLTLVYNERPMKFDGLANLQTRPERHRPQSRVNADLPEVGTCVGQCSSSLSMGRYRPPNFGATAAKLQVSGISLLVLYNVSSWNIVHGKQMCN
jgi:hypothetical protein